MRVTSRKRRTAWKYASLLALLLLLLPGSWSVAFGQQQGNAGGATGAGSTTNAPNRLDWRSYGNDLGNTRFVNLDQINPSNVAQLQPAWVLHLNYEVNNAASLETQPIVVNGVMYLTSPHDHVYAVNAATGDVLWTYSPTDMPKMEEMAICCGQTNRGVAVGDGKVFLARLDAMLVALDAGTGQVLWQVPVDDWRGGWTETMAPQFVDGKVLVGASGGEFLMRGHLSAYDAQTGRMLWRFYTVPGPGEPGHDTWAGDSWTHGGATVWSTPAVDPQLGMVYFGAGNAAPDIDGSDRAGQNLFTASVVALDLNTGQYRWHFQEVHHDIWDYDGPEPTLLFDMNVNGQRIPALGHANKNGFYFILDRRNGQPIFPVQEAPAPQQPAWQNPWPTQPLPATESLIPHQVQPADVPQGMHSVPMYTPPGREPVLIQPGAESGPEWPPAAYSPRTGFIYVPAGGYEPWVMKAGPESNNTIGSTLSGSPNLKGNPQFGLFQALDTATGRIAWTIRTAVKTLTGMTVAGDLVFMGDSDGTFLASDARSGQVLWRWNAQRSNVGRAGQLQRANTAGNGIGAPNAPPAVYVVNGREYVVMAFGGNFRQRADVPDGYSAPGDAIIAFALPQRGQMGQGNQQQPNIVTANVTKVGGRLFPPDEADRVSGMSQPPSGAYVVELAAHDFNFFPNTFTVPAGMPVAVHLRNTDPIAATGFVVRLPKRSLALNGLVKPGEDKYITFSAPTQPGQYEFFSEVGNAVRFFGANGFMRVVPSGQVSQGNQGGQANLGQLAAGQQAQSAQQQRQSSQPKQQGQPGQQGQRQAQQQAQNQHGAQAAQGQPGQPAQTVRVAMQNIRFNPPQLTISAGTTVVWTNQDPVAHTTTSGQPGHPDGKWDSGILRPGESYRRTFSQPGTYPYYCTIHQQQMQGVIIVQ